MATIDAAFHLISSALQADQSALNIVSNNVANANTPGYTRQVPNWQENAPVAICGALLGTGASVTGSTSVRDRVLEQRLAQQQQAESASGSRLTALDTLQTLFALDSGSNGSTAGDIGADITSFFSSFSALETNPSDDALRQQVLSTARLIAGDMSNAASSLNTQRSALDQEAVGDISQINALTSSIARLNQQIQSNSPNSDAGILEDQRQQDISKLSQLIGINQIASENNGLSITTTAGDLLVAEGSSYALRSGNVMGYSHLFLGGIDVTAQVAEGGGELGGYLTARDTDIPDILKSLDELAYGISTQVNAINDSGSGLNGVQGTSTSPLYIFTEPTSVTGSAAGMKVIMTDTARIAAASAGKGTGDNSNALALAALSNQPIINGQTPSGWYASLLTNLGSKVSEVRIDNTAQQASISQLQTQRDALSAVNLNDEAASLQQFERSYQAASHVFAILNTIMASALNLGQQTAVS